VSWSTEFRASIARIQSPAVIERFLLSLETEHIRRILVPFGFDAMRRKIAEIEGRIPKYRRRAAS
jgi:hypothetical protein